MLTQEHLKELFTYDSETGIFRNRFSRGRAGAGARAGAETGHGYRRIIVDYDKYYEHHLAWFYVHGEWPGEIDHKNGDRSDNAINNLREATRTQNNWNSKQEAGQSGLRGAYWNDRDQYWYSKIQIGGKVIWLGTHSSAWEAHLAFIATAELHHGEFYSPYAES